MCAPSPLNQSLRVVAPSHNCGIQLVNGSSQSCRVEMTRLKAIPVDTNPRDKLHRVLSTSILTMYVVCRSGSSALDMSEICVIDGPNVRHLVLKYFLLQFKGHVCESWHLPVLHDSSLDSYQLPLSRFTLSLLQHVLRAYTFHSSHIKSLHSVVPALSCRSTSIRMHNVVVRERK